MFTLHPYHRDCVKLEREHVILNMLFDNVIIFSLNIVDQL